MQLKVGLRYVIFFTEQNKKYCNHNYHEKMLLHQGCTNCFLILKIMAIISVVITKF